MTDVAFLRAVNLGKRKVVMADLAELVTGLGYGNVWTHINSGNVVFEATGARTKLERKFEAALEEHLGFEVTTFVRAAAELERALALGPFSVGSGDTYFLTFLKDRLTQSGTRALEGLSNDFDTLVVQDRDVHWLMRGKSTDTKLTTKMWADIVGHHRSTSRNVNMLRKLADRIAARPSPA